ASPTANTIMAGTRTRSGTVSDQWNRPMSSRVTATCATATRRIASSARRSAVGPPGRKRSRNIVGSAAVETYSTNANSSAPYTQNRGRWMASPSHRYSAMNAAHRIAFTDKSPLRRRPRGRLFRIIVKVEIEMILGVVRLKPHLDDDVGGQGEVGD